MPDSNNLSNKPQVALIGFGEAGEKFARAGGWHGHARGWDIKPDRRALRVQYGVETAADARGALQGAGIAISLVTADAALAAARDYAPLLPSQSLWCDMNSVSPATKQAAAAAVEEVGGRYVDVAVMAPVDAQLAVPMLLAGRHSAAAKQLLEALGFSNVRIVGDEVGRAAAIKLIRSVMVKGIEALTAEAMLAAHAAGVAEEVLASLDASDKPAPWAKRADYNLERMMVHGLRRAEEMEEVVRTLADLGIDPAMTRGTVKRQRALGSLRIAPAEGLAAKIEQIKDDAG
jgi:3-hydroxyisobutyrate dehydrogenase-like beta-hydroxyacid dehydrogenase